MINYIFLFLGIIYTTFLPGWVVTELFLKKLHLVVKIPLYFFLSIIVSTYFSYFAGLIFGLNLITLAGCLVFFVCLAILILLQRRGISSPRFTLNTTWPYLVAVLVYVIFFTALYPAVFRYYQGNFVMSGPNWQDTAMHLSIIESLTQGNFPPQAPYFAGQPLTYYYFADFHAALVNLFFGQFLPQVLVVINPFLAALFFLAVYSLTYDLTSKKALAVISGLGSVFFGNLSFLVFAKNFWVSKETFLAFVTSHTFQTDGNLYNMTSMADYFLQNRPMMVGLSAFIFVILLLRHNKILWAGIVTAALVKFQMFGFIVSGLFFVFFILVKYLSKRISFRRAVLKAVTFSLPSLILFLIFIPTQIGGNNLLTVFQNNFAWGPWQKESAGWLAHFLFLNLNVTLPLFALSFFLPKNFKNLTLLPFYFTALTIFVVPLTMKFTIYPPDMFKFFYYLIPLMLVILATTYAHWRYKKIALIVFIITTLPVVPTSFILLSHSYANKSVGYSLADKHAGLWLRTHTPPRSVFVTLPTVHCPVTDIAGRLRIISYINWPYSHGFNIGKDNVFSRVRDVEAFYETGDASLVKSKYNASYIFVGSEESSKFPDAKVKLDLSSQFVKVYDQEGIAIYQIH